ncbi:hypothetical protein AKO1_005896, partial [Acrasis kona]
NETLSENLASTDACQSHRIKHVLNLTDASCDIMIVPLESLGGEPKQKTVSKQPRS